MSLITCLAEPQAGCHFKPSGRPAESRSLPVQRASRALDTRMARQLNQKTSRILGAPSCDLHDAAPTVARASSLTPSVGKDSATRPPLSLGWPLSVKGQPPVLGGMGRKPRVAEEAAISAMSRVDIACSFIGSRSTGSSLSAFIRPAGMGIRKAYPTGSPLCRKRGEPSGRLDFSGRPFLWIVPTLSDLQEGDG